MKRVLLVVLAVLCVSQLYSKERKMISRYNKITKTTASYPEVTIHDLQYVAPESLINAEAYQSCSCSQWSWQVSDHGKLADTVVITAIVMAPAHVISYTAQGWTMLLHDTAANSNQWGGILVRHGSNPENAFAPDSEQARLDGFENVSAGWVIRMTGFVEEFPAGTMNSTTQFRPIYGIDIERVGNKPIPEPTHLNVTDLYVGGYPGGTVKYSTAEMYEGSYVVFTGLKVTERLNTARGTWVMKDASGNSISDLDASHYFTFGNGTITIPGDPSFVYPNIGAVIDTIRGTLINNSGQEAPRGYRICPIFPGDVVIGPTYPFVTTGRRYPVTVTSNDSVLITARALQLDGGYPIVSVTLYTSLNSGPWTTTAMDIVDTGSTYGAYIIDQDNNPLPANTQVRYFVKAVDDHSLETILANGAGGEFANDTSRGLFFYTVLDRPYTINDVQYTPYANGRSPYVGAIVTLSGVVTASSNELNKAALSTGGTNAYYIQNGNAPYSGMWVVAGTLSADTTLSTVLIGDSIVVTGTLQENFDVTRLFDSLVTIVSHNHPLPQPITISTGTFGVHGNGYQQAEQYEGMLVRILDGNVTSRNFWTFADSTEYAVDDGSGPVLIRRDGINKYGNQVGDTVLNKTILNPDDPVDTLIGVAYYSFGRYKITPRTDADFVAGTPYLYDKGWNLISVGRTQVPYSTGYNKTVLFPTANSQAFSFQSGAGYTQAAALVPDKGYWLKFPNASSIRQFGNKRTNDTVAVSAGWNLIGTIGNSVLTNTITVLPGGNSISSQFYGYSSGYNVATTLVPSKGYWVKVAQTGSLVVAANSFAKANPSIVDVDQFNSITITDKNGKSQTLRFGQNTDGKMNLESFEMPPTSPDGEVAARFASGRILEAYPAVLSAPTAYDILINTAEAPITVSWNIISGDGKKFTLSDASGKTVAMNGTGELKLKKATPKLTLSVLSGPALPKEFALGQNYPNPFNPTTSFVVALPQAAHLNVAVYNILGQKVFTLADEARDAGYYTVTWNGNTQQGFAAASGVYFVRMNSGTFTSIRKMLMMK